MTIEVSMVEKDVVRRGYDAIVETWASERSLDEREGTIFEEFLEPIASPARLLDVGCGQGTPVLDRLDEETAIVGVDLSAGQLEKAAATHPEAAFVQGDMTRLPFDDASFDVLTAFYSLIHVPADEQRSVIDEFARVLRPGGRVLLVDGFGDWHGANPDWLDTGAEMQWHITGAPVTRERLRDVGFTIEAEWELTDLLSDGEHWVHIGACLEG